MYKVLVNCKKYALLKDFFIQTERQFQNISTSAFWDDIISHFKLYNPDVYVCFVESDDTEFITQANSLKDNPCYNGCPIVVVAEPETCDILKISCGDVVTLFIERPIAAVKIMGTITNLLTAIKDGTDFNDFSAAQAAVNQFDDLAAQAQEIESLIPKKHIMVVDDDRAVLKLLKGALSEDYEVTTMANGIMATKFFDGKTCDLILLDYEMPGATGPQVFRILRNMEAAKNIPVVFLTGVSDRQKITEVLSLHPQGYLLKPVDIEKVYNTIVSLIGF